MKVLKWLIIFYFLSMCAQAQEPWRLYYDSTQFYWNKDWGKTVTLLERAERSALSELGLYHENYLTILNDLGTAYWKSRNYTKAEDALSRSLDLKTEVYSTNDKEVMLSISNLAGFYAEKGDFPKSKSLYSRILVSGPAEIPADIYVGAAQNLVSIYDMAQQPDSAKQLLDRIERWTFLPANSFLAFQHKFHRAKIHRKLREYAQASAALADLFDLLKGSEDSSAPEMYVQALQERGLLLLETGAYSAAERALLESYEKAQKHAAADFLLTEVSNSLAQVYDKLNIHDKALQYYRESLARCRAVYNESSLPCVILQNNIAGVHLKQNNVSDAIAAYRQVISDFEKLISSGDPVYITALNNLATAYRKNQQLKHAREYLARAEKLLKKQRANNDDLLAAVLNNLAVVNTAEGEYEKAAGNYRAAYDIKRAIYGENSIVLMDLTSNLAVAYWALGDAGQAIPLFKRSMELATRHINYVFPNLNEPEQVQFYQKLSEDFERFNTIAVQWASRDGELLSRMFQNRAMIKSLQFFTHQRRMRNVRERNDAALNELMLRVKDRRDRLGHLYQLPLDHVKDPAAVTALEKEIDALEKEITMQTTGDGHHAADETRWQALVPRLASDEAVVELIRYRKYDRIASGKKEYFGFADSVHYAALLVTAETREHPALVVLRDGQNLESRFFHYYRNTMKYRIPDELSYHLYWRPLEDHLAGKKKVYFSADGVYHKINVNTLRNPLTGKYLLDETDIVYLLNPMQLLEKRTSHSAIKRNAVLIGDPAFDIETSGPRDRGADGFVALPGTQDELRAIDKVLKSNSWKSTLYLRSAATEENLKSVRSPSVLHIASHGFFSSDVVELNEEAKKEFLFHSGIALSGANKSLSARSTHFQNDGIVTAFEVMNLDLAHTHLVVLSACETGLGKIENGEGVFGLQRSFMQAGARNVLISLWKVDDEATRDLMIAFYRHLAAGASLRDALKKAQSEQARRLADPSLWGGFVLVGND